MSDEIEDRSRRGRTRRKLEPRPTGKRVDPATLVAEMYERYPVVMQHLHEAEVDDMPTSSIH